MENRYKNICVFCGASNFVSDDYIKLAEECGEIIGKNNLRLVFGGGGSGLMEALAKSASQNNARVLAVFPRFLEEYEPLTKHASQYCFVETLQERKEVMINESDAFIVLPGGFGTLDEFFEVITLKILKRISSPVIIVNYNNYWKPLIDMIQQIFSENFSASSNENVIKIASNLPDAFKILQG